MKIRLIAVLVVFIMFSTLVQAADKATKATVSEVATGRSTLLQTAGSGLNITSNSQQYQILSGVRAAEIKANEQPQQALTRMGGGTLIETKGSFILFSAAQPSQGSVTSVNGTSYPTALNSRTGGIGIVPGTLNVKLKKNGNAAAIAKDHGLEVERAFAHLQTAFFRIKPGQDVVAAAASLAADARVVSAEIEVIEHISAPN